jgi:hypothetical protein
MPSNSNAATRGQLTSIEQPKSVGMRAECDEHRIAELNAS